MDNIHVYVRNYVPQCHAYRMFANLFESHLDMNSDPFLSQFGSFPNHQWILEHKVKEQLPLFLNKKQTIAMFTLYNNMHMSVDVIKFC